MNTQINKIITILLAIFLNNALLLAQCTLGPGDVTPKVWSPAANAWVNGNATGYAEGQSAALLLMIKDTACNNVVLDVCLEVYKDNKDTYAFIGFSDWNASFG